MFSNINNNIAVEGYHNLQDVIDNGNERSSDIISSNNNEINELIDQSFKWIKIPLCDFSFKCIQSKHDLCSWKKCRCLCH
jgi:hypothetical protein